MIPMPAAVVDTAASIDWSGMQSVVADYGPAFRVLRDTWDKETLREIAQGHLFVSDALINEAIAKKINGDGPVKKLTIASHDNGRMNIAADTKKVGTVELSGTIDEFVHEGDKSYIVYHVRSKNIRDHGLMSWMFSRISLGMAQRLVGNLDVPEDIPVKIHGNRVRIDGSQVLAESAFGRTTFQGQRLLDMIEVKGAVPKDGGIDFQTELHVPPAVQRALLALAVAAID